MKSNEFAQFILNNTVKFTLVCIHNTMSFYCVVPIGLVGITLMLLEWIFGINKYMVNVGLMLCFLSLLSYACVWIVIKENKKYFKTITLNKKISKYISYLIVLNKSEDNFYKYISPRISKNIVNLQRTISQNLENMNVQEIMFLETFLSYLLMRNCEFNILKMDKIDKDRLEKDNKLIHLLNILKSLDTFIPMLKEEISNRSFKEYLPTI